ncbi:MAG: 2-oxo acid dehydrogenase subunit E2 [Candidatus Nanopelagicales bacterium]|jgi:2-oxoglutarate dehydrogenase E2 component (dihydrolipoamide succinyltransferase)|nr:2-oxo acid dehydrogenase subunit E2 [Candidatus Nanopelagicales bacterium]
MSVTVTMPQLGESVTEGTVTRWLKQVGEEVRADEPLVEVSTDKVDTEIPAPASGVLLSIAAGEDETVAVGAPLGVIGESGEAPAAAAPAAPAAPEAAEPAAAAVPAPAPVQAVAAPPARPAVAPAAAAAAASLGSVPPDPNPPRSGSQAVSGTETPVILPALGESVTEGTVTRWLKKVGDMVSADEPLLEVSTDKVDTELPAPSSGMLLEIRVSEDETAEVGQTLGIIGTPAPAGAPAPTPAPEPVAPPAPVVAAAEAAAPAPASQAAPAEVAPAGDAPSAGAHASAAPSDLYVTPLVRKLAAQSGVDLSTVRGTGVGGRITKQDIFDAKNRPAGEAPATTAAAPTPAAAAPAAPVATPAPAPGAEPAPAPAATPAAAPAAPAPAGARTQKLTRLRKVIAERMVESLHVSAQLTTVVEADVTRIAALRAKHKNSFQAREGVKLSFMPFFTKAIIEALKAYPVVNASIDQAAGTVTYHDAIHLGIAVDTERGLLVPVVRDADDLNLGGLGRKIADIAERTRTNNVSPDELSGGTFTITNTGSRGALFDTPIINQPQVAILGLGAIVRRPVVVVDETGADSIAIRSMVYLALTYDHRLVDGADAARFLTTLKARLESGDFEAELG